MPNTGTEKFEPSDAQAGERALGSNDTESAKLSTGLRTDGKDFLKTLQESNSADARGSNALADFDGDAGPPTLVDTSSPEIYLAEAQSQEGKNKTESQRDKPDQIVVDGKVVRERSAPGDDTENDTVIAYDKDGKAHRFEDRKIESLPVDFKSIPKWRQEQIAERAGPLIEKYTEGETPDGKPDGQISFNDVASMMKDVAGMEDLTEVEKARLWSDVRISLRKNDVDILDADEKPEMIDSWKGSDDPWHAIITMNDGYHGDRLINMSPEDATKAILDHENGAEANKMPLVKGLIWRGAKMVLGVNQGDINASEGTLRALRAYREQGTFDAYAEAWKNEFVREDVDQYGRPR